MNRMDLSELFTAQVRGLQSLYPTAHRALTNWGLWSMDRAGIFPSLSAPSMWDQAIHSKFGDFADEADDRAGYAEQTEFKAERIEQEPFDEKSANELDEWLHEGCGTEDERFPWSIRRCLIVAYVTREVPERDFPRLSKCGHDDFLARLESVLGAI